MEQWITQTAEQMGLLGVGLMMFLENIFPPVPSEIVMPAAGFAAQQGELSFVGVVLAGAVGSLLGVIPWYFVARWAGKKRMRRWVERHGKWLTMSADDFDRAVKWFDRYGGAAVFLCRLAPGIRTLISVPAGFAEMPFVRFLIYSALGTFIWTLALAAIGWWLRDQYDAIRPYLGWTAAAIFAALAAWYIYRFVQKRRESRQEQQAYS